MRVHSISIAFHLERGTRMRTAKHWWTIWISKTQETLAYQLFINVDHLYHLVKTNTSHLLRFHIIIITIPPLFSLIIIFVPHHPLTLSHCVRPSSSVIIKIKCFGFAAVVSFLVTWRHNRDTPWASWNWIRSNWRTATTWHPVASRTGRGTFRNRTDDGLAGSAVPYLRQRRQLPHRRQCLFPCRNLPFRTCRPWLFCVFVWSWFLFFICFLLALFFACQDCGLSL